jgi:hypothetical protein
MTSDRLSEQLDRLADKLDAMDDKLTTRLASHDLELERLRVTQRWVLGALAALGLGGSGVAGLLQLLGGGQ